jgi:cytochrome c peroxidase
MTPEAVELGRHLFYDERLSGTETQACASCHRQELAFTDGRARAVGATGQLHPRSAMSLANVAYGARLGWADPELDSLEAQARVPLLGEQPVEMALAGKEEAVMRRLAETDLYPRLFERAFPGEPHPIHLDNVVRALASFERTLLSGASPYDRLLFQDDPSALSPSALRGMRLFFSSRLRCSNCHGGLLFSAPAVTADPGGRADPPAFHNTALHDLDGRGAYPFPNEGLYRSTGRAADMGRFRAPTLRNVAVTAPYMHDGSIATLDAVLDHYAAAGRAASNPYKSPELVGFELSRGERRDVIAFLRSLTDPAFLSDPRFADPFAAANEATGR